MDATVLAKKLDDVIAQLKQMSGGYSFYDKTEADGKTRKKVRISKEEQAKLKRVAGINATEYKKVLGVGFSPENASKLTKVFDRILSATAATGGSANLSVKNLIKGLEWVDLKDSLLGYVNFQKIYQRAILDKIGELVHLSDKSKKPKEEKKESAMSMFKNIAGLAIIGVGLFLIVNALTKSGDIDPVKVLKVLGIVALLVGIFVLVGKIGGGIKNAAIGFGLLAATMMFLVIPLIEKFKKMEWSVLLDGLSKFALVAGACIGLMVLMKFIKKSDVIVATGGIIVLALTVGFLLLPLFQRLNEFSWDSIIDGLGKFGIIVGVCIGLMWLMSTIKKGNVIVATAAMGMLVFLIGYLADQLEKYAFKPWDAIAEGLKIAGIAFGAFFAMFSLIAIGTKAFGKAAIALTGAIMFELVYLLGYMADNLEKYANKDWDSIVEGLKVAGVAFGSLVVVVGILAAALAAGGPITIVAGAVGAGIMMALAKVLSMTADSLEKYQTIDGDKLIQVAKGMVAIAGGLAAMLVGTGAGVAGGIVNGLASLIGVDPVSFLQKFEKLNGEKLLNIGTGVKFLAEGLSMLSKGIELKDITKDLINMTSPLVQFSSALVSFADAYKQLDKVKMESEMNQMYKMNVQNDSGIQQAILDLNKQELAVQQAQLDQLKENGNILRQILQKNASGGGGTSVVSSPNSTSVSSPSFNTKDNYMSNLKLTNMALNG